MMIPRDKKGKFIPIKPKLLTKEKSKELAEFIGVMLGDGNLWERNRAYQVRICGHVKDDKKYLLNHVKPLIKKLFNLDARYRKHRTINELFLIIDRKDLLFTLKHYGLKSGNKIKNNCEIPDWVFESDEYLKACIRGLIDTDGTVIPITGRNYTYIWFTSSIPNLRKSFEKAMNQLGYKIAKWNYSKNSSRGPETYIGAKHLIRKYYKEIGFNNLKHERRFMMPL